MKGLLRKIFSTLVILLFLGVLLQTTALAQEGVLHRLARAVLAVPKAVLSSLEGPRSGTGDCSGCGDQICVQFPQSPYCCSSQTNYYIAPFDNSYGAPNYVTYQVVVPRPATNRRDSANVHIYSSIPFENR